MNTVQAARSKTVASRGRLLEAARVRFVRDGYERFSMRGLAADLGCAVGTLYLHFASKEALLQAVAEASFERLSQSLKCLCERHANGDPVVLLKKAMYTYVEFGLRNPGEYEFACRRVATKQRCLVDAVFEVLRYIVGRCVEEERFFEMDIETVAQALWAAAHGITSLLIQQPDFPWVSRSKLIQQVIQNAVNNLVTKAAQAKVVA